MDIKKIGLWTGGIVAALFIARDLQDRMELGSLNKASELGKIRDEWLISNSVTHFRITRHIWPTGLCGARGSSIRILEC